MDTLYPKLRVSNKALLEGAEDLDNRYTDIHSLKFVFLCATNFCRKEIDWMTTLASLLVPAHWYISRRGPSPHFHSRSPIYYREVVSMTSVESAIPDRIEAHAESETDDADWRSVASEADEKTAHITLLVKWESSRQVISREIANARDLRDMSFIPNESDDLGDLTPMGKIVSVATLATTGDSVLREVVLESEPEKKLVAKYTNDCSQKLMEPWGGDLHPLVSEYAFLMVTNATGITPNVYNLSPMTQVVCASVSCVGQRSSPQGALIFGTSDTDSSCFSARGVE